MKVRKELRSFVPAAGSFVSLPEAFESADSGVKLAPKIELQVGKFSEVVLSSCKGCVHTKGSTRQQQNG